MPAKRGLRASSVAECRTHLRQVEIFVKEHPQGVFTAYIICVCPVTNCVGHWRVADRMSR
eukprot:1136811-Pelagomonas_calceolata.AAC.1